MQKLKRLRVAKTAFKKNNIETWDQDRQQGGHELTSSQEHTECTPIFTAVPPER